MEQFNLQEVRVKTKISIVTDKGESSNYLIPKGKHTNFNQGEKIKKGEYLLDGAPHHTISLEF